MVSDSGAAELRRMGVDLSALSQVLEASVVKQVRALLREEFAKGVGPDGEPWQKTVKGRPAMISRKLPNAFSVATEGTQMVFTGKTKRDMLAALNAGHTFTARRIAANKSYLSFNKKGELIGAKKIFNKKGDVKRGVYQRFAKAHTVGARTLPARPIYPDGFTPPRWDSKLQAGVRAAVKQWGAAADAST